MKIGRNQILVVSLALLLTLPAIAILTPMAKAEEGTYEAQNLPVKTEEHWRGIWYKFETPLITLIFPAGGKKPMFLWWYTEDNSTIYVVKFRGIVEYLTFDLPYYDRRYPADGLIIQEKIKEKYIEPKLNQLQHPMHQQTREKIMKQLTAWLIGLHPHYLPFSACSWTLEGPVKNDDVSYWSFNFTLKKAPMFAFRFAENNIQIRCRFYNTTATETPDPNHPEYNYTVAAGQLKFDFVVSNWTWNIDKIKNFVEWLNQNHPELNIVIPPHKTGLALWINMASIKLEDISVAEDDVQNQYQETVEAKSQMQAATVNGQYHQVSANETEKGQYERQLQLTTKFRERARIQFARREKTFAGFLEFVPWARLLNETGDTVDYVNVTASYIAAGHHLRLFLCYPYFGNYTLEHDPTIGLASAPTIPTLINPIMLAILIGTTVAIAIAIAAIKIRKKTVNIVNVQ